MPIINFNDHYGINDVQMDTTFTTKDTSIAIFSTTYDHCVYANHIRQYIGFGTSGGGGYYQNYSSFSKPGVGIVYEYFTPEIKQVFYGMNYYGLFSTVRRLTNYSIK